MGGVFFLATFICLGVVVVWFIHNESRKSSGHLGLLAVRPSEGAAKDDVDIQAARYTVRNARNAIEKDLGELEHVRRIAAEKNAAENKAHTFRKKDGVAFQASTTRRHRRKERVKPVKR